MKIKSRWLPILHWLVPPSNREYAHVRQVLQRCQHVGVKQHVGVDIRNLIMLFVWPKVPILPRTLRLNVCSGFSQQMFRHFFRF